MTLPPPLLAAVLSWGIPDRLFSSACNALPHSSLLVSRNSTASLHLHQVEIIFATGLEVRLWAIITDSQRPSLQATLGIGSSTEKSTLQCAHGDNEPISLCTLLPDKVETLTLNMKVDALVKLSVLGSRSIHLTGHCDHQTIGSIADVIREVNQEGADRVAAQDLFPNEILQLILVNLSVPTLLTFKCVCKSWGSLISDPIFSKSQFDTASYMSCDRLLLNCLYQEDLIGSLNLDWPLDVIEEAPYIKFPHQFRDCYFFGSCRGLLLVGCRDNGNCFVWNPSTGFQQIIPNISMKTFIKWKHRSSFLIGFGYDNKEFSIVFVELNDPAGVVKVILFSLTSYSSIILETKEGGYYADHMTWPDFIGVLRDDSRLYWLVTKGAARQPVVIQVDLVNSEFEEISLSSDLEEHVAMKQFDLRVLGSRLCLCYKGARGDKAQIWVYLDEYNCWLKGFDISVDKFSNTCFIPLQYSGNWHVIEKPFAVRPEGKLTGINGIGTILRFDQTKSRIQQFKYEHGYKFDSLDKPFQMYVESLLSIPPPPESRCINHSRIHPNQSSSCSNSE